MNNRYKTKKVPLKDLVANIPKPVKITHLPDHPAGMQISMLDITHIHPLASGNKLFKLAYNIDKALQQGYKQVISFGGAFSNHIYALAAYTQAKDMQSIGIIRGEPEYADNPTLSAARQWGMQLRFVDRKTYRQRYDPAWLRTLAAEYPDALIVPEGGSNALAVKGCMQLSNMLNQLTENPIDRVALACGTGGTLAGLVAGSLPEQTVMGFPVVRDSGIATRINQLLNEVNCEQRNYQLIAADYGGYARFDKAQLDFIMHWLEHTGILLDPIYTSKMCRRLQQMIAGGELAQPQHICLLHTGGLQAWYGMRDKVIDLAGEGAWCEISARL